MPTETVVRPAIERPDATIALVEEVSTGDAERQQSAAAEVVKHWESAKWPAGLVAQSLFTSTDGETLLTFAQWSTAEALEKSLKQPQNSARPDWKALGIEPGTPQAVELYRRVQPTVLPDPMPVIQCYPVAFFAMDNAEAARQWVDGLLGKEEEDFDKDRDYPGALAANFHVAADGSGIFLISEWASETDAINHIKAEIMPLLEYMGQAEAGAGTLNSFYATVTPDL
jgi:hypothetical protein